MTESIATGQEAVSMRWERRKSRWPVLTALGLLFVFALTAPQSWQWDGSLQNPDINRPQPVEPSLPDEQPELLVKPFLAASEACLAPDNVTISEPLPVCREFNLDTLLLLRDSLLAIVDQLPAPRQISSSVPSVPPTREPTPQVRVTSENDRLAMLPHRRSVLVKRATPTLPAKVPVESLTEVTEEEAANFAAILSEAARSPEPLQARSRAGLRLATRPTPSNAGDRPVGTKPQLKQSLPGQIRPIEPSPLHHPPQALIEQLESFSVSSPGAVWSQQVLSQLRSLFEDGPVERPEVSLALSQLEQLHETGMSQAEQPANFAYRNQWQHAAQSLGRRLAIWRLLLDSQRPTITRETNSSTAMLAILGELATLLKEEQNGDDWRNYLLLDQIAAATSEGMSSAPSKRAKLAQQVLTRMTEPQLTAAQREFLTTTPFIQLHEELRPWAAGIVNLDTLAALVERYETSREMRFAVAIAQLQQRLKWSNDPQLQALAAHFQQHYRGANMRIAMSDDLLNRMMPKQEPTVTPVRESIAGTKVRGRARTTTQVRVRLVPDSDAWHFALEAFGKVYSDTRSDTWPARIRNATKLRYQGRKEISIDEQGLHVSPAQANAQGRNELVGVDSQLDPIPIVGLLLRDFARQKHKKSRPLANNQAKAKVVRTVKQRMNASTDQKLEALEQKFRENILAPIEQLALLAEPLDMHTTAERAVMQLRLANSGQLAAHTLRPLAPSDSVLSLQLHETALNNAMMGLGLDGRRMTMLELFEFFSRRFGQADASPPADMPHGAVIEFASRGAFRVQCEGDRLVLVMDVTELAYRRDKIKNFQIHVHFRPVLSGLDVRLVRDGPLQFSGRRLKTGPRIVLHSVMGKMLLNGQEIRLLGTKLMADPRLADLMVSQLVIEDGWIGLALSPARPRRTAWQSPSPEVLPTPFVR